MRFCSDDIMCFSYLLRYWLLSRIQFAKRFWWNHRVFGLLTKTIVCRFGINTDHFINVWKHIVIFQRLIHWHSLNERVLSSSPFRRPKWQKLQCQCFGHYVLYWSKNNVASIYINSVAIIQHQVCNMSQNYMDVKLIIKVAITAFIEELQTFFCDLKGVKISVLAAWLQTSSIKKHLSIMDSLVTAEINWPGGQMSFCFTCPVT